MELLVIIADINECPENIWWEYHLEGFPILLNRVQKPEAPQAMELKFVLYFDIFLRIVKVSLGLLVFVDPWTMIHKNFANDVCPVKPNLDIVCIVQR